MSQVTIASGVRAAAELEPDDPSIAHGAHDALGDALGDALLADADERVQVMRFPLEEALLLGRDLGGLSVIAGGGG